METDGHGPSNCDAQDHAYSDETNNDQQEHSLPMAECTQHPLPRPISQIPGASDPGTTHNRYPEKAVSRQSERTSHKPPSKIQCYINL